MPADIKSFFKLVDRLYDTGRPLHVLRIKIAQAFLLHAEI